MNQFRAIGVPILAASAALIGLLWLSNRTNPELREVIIRIDGPSETVVAFAAEVDGQTITEERRLPCEITVTVRQRLFFSVYRTDGPESNFRVELSADGVSRGHAMSSGSVMGRIGFQGTRVVLFSLTGF